MLASMTRTEIRQVAGISISGVARIAGVCESSVKWYELTGEIRGRYKNESLAMVYEWMLRVPYRGVRVAATGLPVR